MSRDHLRIVSSKITPSAVTQMETLTFAQVEGGLVILHNDDRIAPSAAVDVLVKMTRMVKALAEPHRSVDAELRVRRLLPGDLGGMELADLGDVDVIAITPPCKPLFTQDRHKRGYPGERPRPICAETDGDCS